MNEACDRLLTSGEVRESSEDRRYEDQRSRKPIKNFPSHAGELSFDWSQFKLGFSKLQPIAYLVRFVEDDDSIFLKTIIPSRKATKQYLNRERNNETES